MWISSKGGVEEAAHQYSRRRSLMFLVMLPVYLVVQAVVLIELAGKDEVQGSTLIATNVITVIMLVTVANGGRARRLPARIFAAINDDVTRSHRLLAQQAGFWAALGTAALAFVADGLVPLTGSQGLYLTITVGTAAAVLRFALLERRALRG